MESTSLIDFENLGSVEFEELADQVGAFVLDHDELCDLLNTAGATARETDVYKNLYGIFIRREIVETAKFGLSNM